MNEETNHNHSFKELKEKKVLTLILILTMCFMVVEVIAGFYTGSLALLSDATHMFTDVFAISVALLALWFSLRPPTSGKTFGFYRAEILAAFFNSLILLGISIGIIVEAYKRLSNPSEVKSLEMTVVAVIGLFVNLLGVFLLSKYRSKNLNIKGAFYHIISDAIGSLGTLAAGLIMLKTRWYYADPAISILISFLIIRAAWVLLQDSIHILLEGTPKGIDLKSVETAICSHDGVLGVHDLHAWTLTQGFEALSAHMVVRDMGISEGLIEEIKRNLYSKFKISHVTLQAETRECEPINMTCYESRTHS